jgi:competence protein ComEC
MIYLCAISAGIFSVAFYTVLPSMQFYLGLFSGISLSWVAVECSSLRIKGFIKSTLCLALLLGFGSAWGVFCAYGVMSHQLPDTLDRHDFLVTGTVSKVLKADKIRTNFSVIVHSAYDMEGANNSIPLKKILLNDYSSMAKKGLLDIQEGDRWQLVVRLKRPRGTLNPGGFDYQSWLLQSGYSATGYVKSNPLNIKQYGHSVGVIQTALLYVSDLRAKIRYAIIKSDLSELGGAILVALTVGDRTQIRPWWESLAKLGIVHLLVISGLHVGLIAGVGFVFASIVVKALATLNKAFSVMDNPHSFFRFLPPIFALLVAAGYSLLAGFTLPTQRALIAIAVVMLGKLLYRRITPWACVAWTLLIIATLQPLAILSAGFWLTFTAVITLVGWFYPWASSDKNFRKKRVVTAQLALLSLMSLPLLLFLGRISWLSPFINAMAIPLVSMLTVPLALLGVVFLVFSESIAQSIWTLADWSTAPIQWLLDVIPKSYGFLFLPVVMDWKILAALLMACLAVLLPIPKVYKLVSIVPLCLALLAPNAGVNLRLTVLDVGQGLAAVVELGDKTLIYDSGPRYSETFDAGSGIIIPYLRSRARRSVDHIVISHEDSDHSGGAMSLIDTLGASSVLVGPGFVDRLDNYIQETPHSPLKYSQCLAGQRWSWSSSSGQVNSEEIGSAKFEVIWPTKDGPKEGNNSSCVLQITWRDTLILLTGDIEARAERRIIKEKLIEGINVSVLLAPHHGSKTSSSDQFLNVLKPKDVVFSSGHRHHFGHPHHEVVKRYEKLGTRIWKTAEQGAVTFSWNEHGILDISSARDQRFPDCLTCGAWWR